MPTEKPTFEELVQEHAPFVRRTLAQLGVSARDLADVEQEVFRGADRGLPAFDPSLSCNPETAVRGWLFGICERQAASHRRAEIKRGEILFATEELDFAASAAPSVEENLIDHERKVLLHRLLESLEPHRRAVVIAYELEGVAMTDVAAALSIPVNTAWNRLRLGREDLRAAWRRLARKEGRGAPLPPLGALFGGAAWCSEGSGATGSLSRVGPENGARAKTGSLSSAPTGHLPAAQGGVSASSGAALPSVLMAPAHATAFGALALGVPLALTAMLVLGAGEEPPALPETEPRPAVAVMAPGPAVPAALGISAPGQVSRGPVLATTGGRALNVSETDRDAGSTAGGAGQSGLAAAPPPAIALAPSLPIAAGSPAAAGGVGRGPEPGGLRQERKSIEGAMGALERGDLRAAKDALDAHRQRHEEGKLAPERELLWVRVLLAEGRRNEARDRVRAFLEKHPDTPFRAQLEALVATTK